MLFSYFTSVQIKITVWENQRNINITSIRPVVSYARCTRVTTAGDEKRLNIFERKELRKIYGPVHNPDTQVWKRRSNEQVQQLYGKGSTIQFVKGARLEWAGHVRRSDDGIVETVLVDKFNRKRSRGKPKPPWLDVIKKDTKEPRPDWNEDMNHAYTIVRSGRIWYWRQRA